MTMSSSFLHFFHIYVICGRMEKKPVTFRIDPNMIKKFKYLALDHDKTLTDLFLEAIQDLLKKYEKEAKK